MLLNTSKGKIVTYSLVCVFVLLLECLHAVQCFWCFFLLFVLLVLLACATSCCKKNEKFKIALITLFILLFFYAYLHVLSSFELVKSFCKTLLIITITFLIVALITICAKFFILIIFFESIPQTKALFTRLERIIKFCVTPSTIAADIPVSVCIKPTPYVAFFFFLQPYTSRKIHCSV